MNKFCFFLVVKKKYFFISFSENKNDLHLLTLRTIDINDHCNYLIHHFLFKVNYKKKVLMTCIFG